VTRRYGDWETDARTTTKSVTKLGNELRDRWDDWKREAPYDSWEACIRGELGITGDALRMRNMRSRKTATVTPVTAAKLQPVPPPMRPGPTTTAEIERRRQHASVLWQAGHTAKTIADVLGVSKKTAEIDLAAKGSEGRRSRVSKPDEVPDQDYRWRNGDLGITNEESTIERPSFASCETPTAREAIEDIRNQLLIILGGRYQLSLKDRNNLITVLESALERARHGNEEEANSSLAHPRIAG